MERRVQELLEQKGGSYILPFFWQHGEEETVLREYMGAIYDSNIREVCLECRPHPDFMGPKWWKDMDIIMEEARERGMKVWLLDDSHFPTGYANGGFEEADPALCKQYMSFVTGDVHGMTHGVVFHVSEAIAEQEEAWEKPTMIMPGMELPKRRHFDTSQIWKVMAYQIVKGEALGKGMDITDSLKGDVLIWDVPEGMWRIYVIYFTQNGGGRTDYMNILNRDSVRVLIDQVYEPVYARYGADFGKTFKGFFSDEPLAGNCADQYDDRTFIGERRMPLPWSPEMAELLQEQLGESWLSLMPLLWDRGSNAQQTGQVRYAYMNAMTLLVQDNFSLQVGNWCQAHGVEYIGHMVEDQNRSATVNYLGDYFRALKGQHMAGIDVIGGGIVPGGENRIAGGPYQPDGDFYHFMLAKLGASFAHLDSRKKGRTMVELFGAYGWDFGVKNMKYLADHFLVRGVNHFTPHAFSPKEFPDPDCPPHFYAHGENPQFRAFGKLMSYMQRTAHLINGGIHVAPVALLHSGMASWSGKRMDAEKPARELMECQIDFDVIPPQILGTEDCVLTKEGLHINGETFQVLVIPRFEFINENVARFCEQAYRIGFPVLFVGGKPVMGADFNMTGELPGEIVSLEQLTLTLRERGMAEISIQPASSGIRYFHYRQEGDIYLFSNESLGNDYHGTVTLPAKGYACIYDAMENVLRPIQQEVCTEGMKLELDLSPYEMKVVFFAHDKAELEAECLTGQVRPGGEKKVLRDFEVSVCESKEYPNFHDRIHLSKPVDIGKYFPDFSGFIRYEAEFETDSVTVGQKYILQVQDAYECVEVWCNDKKAGCRICPAYIFDLSGLVKEGKNFIRIEVATTLVRKVQAIKDVEFGPFFKKTLILEPVGIVGEVALWLQK